jgi:hypothetical protein
VIWASGSFSRISFSISVALIGMIWPRAKHQWESWLSRFSQKMMRKQRN